MTTVETGDDCRFSCRGGVVSERCPGCLKPMTAEPDTNETLWVCNEPECYFVEWNSLQLAQLRATLAHAVEAVTKERDELRDAVAAMVTQNCADCGAVYLTCAEHLTCDATRPARDLLGLLPKAVQP
jgi:hypothetical protein